MEQSGGAIQSASDSTIMLWDVILTNNSATNVRKIE